MAERVGAAVVEMGDIVQDIVRQGNIGRMESEAEIFKVIGIVALVFAVVFIALVFVAYFLLPLTVTILYGVFAFISLAVGVGTIAKYATIQAQIAESRREQDEFRLVRQPLANHGRMVRMATFMQRDERLAERAIIPAGEREEEVQADSRALEQIINGEGLRNSLGDAKREFFRRHHREALCSIQTNQALLLAQHVDDIDLEAEVMLERGQYMFNSVTNRDLIRRNMLADYAGIDGFEAAYDQYMQEVHGGQ